MIEIKIKYGTSMYSRFDISFEFSTKNIEIFIDYPEMIVDTHIDKFPNIHIREHYSTGFLIEWGLYSSSIGYYIGPRLRLWHKLDNSTYLDIALGDVSGFGMTYDRFMYHHQHNDDELSQLFMKFYNDILQTYRIKK
jgi:hypothetical protein